MPTSPEHRGDEDEHLALSAFARLSHYQDRGSLAEAGNSARQTPILPGNEASVGGRGSTAQASDILSDAGKSGATAVGGSPSRIKGSPLETKSLFAGINGGSRGANAEIQQQMAPRNFVQKSFAKVGPQQALTMVCPALAR